MICGWNGWKFLEPVITVIGNSDAVEMFILDEDPCNRISITEAIKHLYTDRSKSFTKKSKSFLLATMLRSSN